MPNKQYNHTKLLIQILYPNRTKNVGKQTTAVTYEPLLYGTPVQVNGYRR